MRANRNNVEKYVQARLRNCVDEKERHRHGYRIAKIYSEIGEYELARKYVSGYLSETPSSAPAHKLLASCLENLGHRSQALSSYQMSFEFEPDQKEILLKICELMCAEDVPVDPQRAEYWIERTRKHFPNDPVLFSLRERVIVENGGGGGGSDEIERLIVSELESKPTDAALRVRLLQHLLYVNKLSSAYRHAREIEKLGTDVFDDDIGWYDTVANVLTRYVRENAPSESSDPDFWMFAVSVHDKLTSLTLADGSGTSTSTCATRLSELDVAVACAVDRADASAPVDRSLVVEFTRHYGAQLCLHVATFLLKKAKSGKMTYRDARHACVPLLVLASAAAPPDANAPWLIDCAEPTRKRIAKWRIEASHRCSQAGRVLLSMLEGKRTNFSDRLAQLCNGDWRRRIFEKIFPDRPASTFASGYFCRCPDFAVPRPVVPTKPELVRYDRDAQSYVTKSLHNTVWIALGSDLAELKLTAFPGLQFSVANLSNCAAETLDALDVRAFVYATTFCAEARKSERTPYNDDRPSVMPVSITDPLCTPAQQEWYGAVYKVYANRFGSDFGGLRITLTRGIEVLRCVGNHGMHVALLVKLARTFAACAKKHVPETERRSVDERAALYWNNAVPLLERMHAGHAVRYGSGGRRLFEYSGAEPHRQEIESYLEEGKVYLALRLKENGEYDKALELLSDLRGPYASYHSAEIYETLAADSVGHDGETVTSEMRSRHVIMLSKARSCVYATLDRLRSPSSGGRDHPLDSVLSQKIEEIESRLARYDSDDIDDRYGFRSRGASNASSTDSVHENIPSRHASRYLSVGSDAAKNVTKSPKSYVHSTRFSTSCTQSTPYRNGVDAHDGFERRAEARPSPERLDAQLRRMTSMFYALEQKIDRLSSRIDDRFARVDDDTKEIKRTTHDLKLMVADNNVQVRQDVTELCKELESKLKSTTQLNDEDLYVLDDDYDYGATIASAQTAYGQNALYPTRATPAAPLAYHAPSLYPNVYAGMYGYAGLPMPAFAEPDFRAVGAVGQPQLTPRAPGLPQPQSLAQVLQPNPLQSAQIAVQSTTQVLQRPLPLLTSQPSYVPAQPVAAAAPVVKSAPVNVVITASDPVPSATTTTAKQPILSVTIPPQHLKINAPRSHVPTRDANVANITAHVPSNPTQTAKTPSRAPVTKSPPFSEERPSPETSSPIVASPITTVHNFQIPLPPNSSFTFSPVFANEALKSTIESPVRDGSDTVEEEHDPCPDFKPIIPLPDEVEVKTGEESELVLYKEHAKLYRYVDKEWRERGVGDLKLLKNAVTGKVRLLMRRDQVHKICANHFLSADMDLQPMTASDRAFVWAANDYADEEVRVEKLCVRFKTAEQAERFKKQFDAAKSSVPPCDPSDQASKLLPPPKTTFDKTPERPAQPIAVEKPNPLAAFSFTASKFVAERPDGTVKRNEPVVERKPDRVEVVDPLPDLVDVKTGGEDEQLVFGARAKLSSYNLSGVQSKERGVGTLKVLVSGIVRILMQADRTSSVLCNHRVTKTMVFSLQPGGTVRWTANDYSDSKMKRESFGAEFLNVDDARRFVDVTTAVQERIDPTGFVVDGPKTSQKGEPPKTDKPGWGDEFRPKTGSWECGSCYVRNDPKDTVCSACDTPKEGGRGKSEIAEVKPASVVGWGDLFKPKAGSWNCDACYVGNDAKADSCVACGTSKDPTAPKRDTPKGINLSDPDAPKFTFGIPPSEQPKFGFSVAADPKPATGEPKFSFGVKPAEPVATFDFSAAVAPAPKPEPAVTFDFGSSTPKAAPKTEPVAKSLFDFSALKPAPKPAEPQKFNFGTAASAFASKSGFVFGAAPDPSGGYTFGQKDASGSPAKYEFAFTPRAPRRSTDDADDSDGAANASEDDGDHIRFSPVVPLPDKVDVKTGEENEDVLYCHRAKLFRYVDGEWKDRGVGNIKILRDRDTGKVRVLMRRDQVLKLCLNHALTAEIEYRPKDERSWIFGASDYSDGDIKRELFCVRFKSAQVASEFKLAIESARSKEPVVTSSPSTPKQTAGDEIEIVYEVEVDPERRRLAEKLCLPPNFYAYEKRAPCPGCIGCDSENYDFDKPRVEKLKGAEPSEDRKGETVKSETTPVSTGSFTFGPSDAGVFSKIHADHESKLTFSFGQKNVETVPKTTVDPPKTTVDPPKMTDPPKTTVDPPKTTVDPLKIPMFGLAANLEPEVSVFPVQKKNSEPSAIQRNLFGGLAQHDNVFASVSLVAAQKQTVFGANDESRGAAVLPDFGLDFASLAAKSNSTLAFSNPNPKTMFSDAGAPVFAHLVKKTAEAAAATTTPGTADADDSTSATADEAEFDPHYEPIVPLPDEIEVETGEESESVEFSSRAKLYRYDATPKEWKERGVGDVKVLKGVDSWRLLMRREQVHKVVLNERIRADGPKFEAMNYSTKAFCWTAQNYVDEATVEQLAIRFKLEETAKQFSDVVAKARADVAWRRTATPAEDQSDITGPNPDESTDNEGSDDRDEDDADYEDYDDEDRTTTFARRCTLSTRPPGGTWTEVGAGGVSVCYVDETFGSKIYVEADDGEILVSCTIGTNTSMRVDDVECAWTAVNYAPPMPVWQDLKARFSDADSAEQFHAAYLEGIQYAQATGIEDTMPTEYDAANET